MLNRETIGPYFAPDTGSGDGCGGIGFSERVQSPDFFSTLTDERLRDRLIEFTSHPLFGITTGGLSVDSAGKLLYDYAGMPMLEARSFIRLAGIKDIIRLSKPSETSRSHGNFCDRQGLIALGLLFSSPEYVFHLQQTRDYFPVVRDLKLRLGDHELGELFAHVDTQGNVSEIVKAPQVVIDRKRFLVREQPLKNSSSVGSPIGEIKKKSQTEVPPKKRTGQQQVASSKRPVLTERYADRYLTNIPTKGRLYERLRKRRKEEREGEHE